MPKKRFTEDAWRRDPWFRSLCSAFAACKSEGELADFLRDIGTLSELKAFSERLEVAKQLAQGIPYRKVAQNTGASTTTVTRVARFLENGEGGYRRILHAYRHRRLALHELAPEGTENRAETSALKRFLKDERKSTEG